MEALKFFNPYEDVKRHTTVLPHWEQPGATYFVTFRLADALPQKKVEAWKLERASWIEAHPKPWTEEVERAYHDRFSSTLERWLDAGHGNCVLRDSWAARVVGDALNHFEGERCVQHAWVVMPNHVHVLFMLRAGQSVATMLHSWKSFTAQQIQAARGEKGPLWQRDYFDRLIRDSTHFHRCVRYIRKNPVKAGLREGEFLLFESDWVRERVR